MKDRNFLMWIHERLVNVHGENERYDYMHKLRSIICATPKDQDTPAMSSCLANSLDELRKWIDSVSENQDASSISNDVTDYLIELNKWVNSKLLEETKDAK